MKKIYIAPQSDNLLLNVNGYILDNHFCNHSVLPVEQTNPKPGDRGETGGVDGFEAKENEWGEIAFTPWED